MKPILILVILELILVARAWGQIAPPSAQVKSVRLMGTGCDESNATVSLSPNLQSMTVLFDNFTAEIGPGSARPTAALNLKNCRVIVNMAVPSGWQYAFKSVDYRGFVNLPAKTWAGQRILLLSDLNSSPTFQQLVHHGPLNSDYTFHVEAKEGRKVWSSCIKDFHQMIFITQIGVGININTPKEAPRPSAQIILDSQDFSTEQSIGLEWRPCMVQN